MSIREEMPTSLCSRSWPPAVRLVKTLVIPWLFRKSISRVSIALTSAESPMLSMFVIGSRTTARGLNSSTSLWRVARCISRP